VCKIKEVLRPSKEIGLFERQIAKSCGISQSTVKELSQPGSKRKDEWDLAPPISMMLTLIISFFFNPNDHFRKSWNTSPGFSLPRAKEERSHSSASMVQI